MSRGVAVFVVVCTLFCSSDATAAPPVKNVVFFLIDDLGWRDLGCYGSTFYETPHIDQLAAEGMRFTDAYAACCICSPTRAAVLTGKYPARLMLTEWLPSGRWDARRYRLKEGRYLSALPLEEVTLAETLRQHDYATGFFGKWHLGGPSYYLPEHQGFDVNIGGDDHGAPADYFYPYEGDWRIPTTGLSAHWRTLDSGEPGEYLTDRLTDEALEFMRAHRDEPMLVYLSHYAVHTPLQAPAETVERYSTKATSGGQGNAKYAAKIEHVDRSVGRVMDTLGELGLADDTLVIFTSDNGGVGKVTSNAPLRGNKGNFYEGGIRVPAIVWCPPLVKAGSVSHEPITSSDFFPTILACLGLPLRPHQHEDGENLLPLITGQEDLKREALYWHYPHYVTNHPNPATPMSVIRQGHWKLLEFFEDGHLELYNLRDDLGEQHDLARQQPERAAKLQAKLAAWREAVRAEMPRENPDYAGQQ